MLKYQKIIIGFIILIVSVIIIDYFTSVTIFLYLGIILLLTGLLVYGSVSLRSGYYCDALCSADNEMKSIALTFDDGPDAKGTPAILEILRKYDVRAAFFCIGKKVEENPELVREIDREGHAIGSHSYLHHFFFDLFSSQKMYFELEKTEAIIYKTISKRIKMFRPPYGVTNPPLARALRRFKYHIIGWSLRSGDTVIKEENLLFNNLAKRLKAGDIILFHDTEYLSVRILDKFIEFAMANGFRFERLDKILEIEAYE